MQIKSTKQIVFFKQNNNPSHYDNKFISILLKSIDMNICFKGLTGDIHFLVCSEEVQIIF